MKERSARNCAEISPAATMETIRSKLQRGSRSVGTASILMTVLIASIALDVWV